MVECDFCGKKGKWKNVLVSDEIKKKDGSELILCNKCFTYYLKGDYDKIDLKNWGVKK